jgi:hypothetical protein
MQARWLALLAWTVSVLPVSAGAQMISLFGDDVPCKSKFLSGEVTADCVPQYIAYVIQQVFSFTGAVALIVIMVGGFQYALGTVAGGKDKAKATIQFGIVGMIVSALAFFILSFIINAIATGA